MRCTVFCRLGIRLLLISFGRRAASCGSNPGLRHYWAATSFEGPHLLCAYSWYGTAPGHSQNKEQLANFQAHVAQCQKQQTLMYLDVLTARVRNSKHDIFGDTGDVAITHAWRLSVQQEECSTHPIEPHASCTADAVRWLLPRVVHHQLASCRSQQRLNLCNSKTTTPAATREDAPHKLVCAQQKKGSTEPLVRSLQPRRRCAIGG